MGNANITVRLNFVTAPALFLLRAGPRPQHQFLLGIVDRDAPKFLRPPLGVNLAYFRPLKIICALTTGSLERFMSSHDPWPGLAALTTGRNQLILRSYYYYERENGILSELCFLKILQANIYLVQ